MVRVSIVRVMQGLPTGDTVRLNIHKLVARCADWQGRIIAVERILVCSLGRHKNIGGPCVALLTLRDIEGLTEALGMISCLRIELAIEVFVYLSQSYSQMCATQAHGTSC